jgi:hypothetical protein
MKRLFCFLWLTYSCLSAHAQFNDTTNYYFRQNANGMINQTNDRDAFVLNNGLRFSLYKKNISLNSTNTWIYGKQQGQLSNNDFTSILDFDLYKTKRSIYYWGLINYEKSFSLKMRHRFQGGIGLGYYVIDSKTFVLQVSNGILYERSVLEPQESVSVADDYHTFRNSFRIKFRYVFKENVTLEHVDFLQHALSDRKDYIIRSNTTIAIKLYKWISMSLVVNYNKLNITERENFLLNYGLILEKYF